MDTSMLAFLAAPFVASLILTGDSRYLGVHVVERGVIFVDLVARPNRGVRSHHRDLMRCRRRSAAPVVYWISLAFTFLGALVFSTIRSKRARIPQEAIIGICYAVASAAAILAMSKATSESEHLKDMLVGNISGGLVGGSGKTALLYARSGRSTTSSAASFSQSRWTRRPPKPRGSRISCGDFLFYASFGFVVTSSVAIAGVLLVFCYLIVAVRRRDVVRGTRSGTARHRLVDGHDRVGARSPALAQTRLPTGDHRLHVRHVLASWRDPAADSARASGRAPGHYADREQGAH